MQHEKPTKETLLKEAQRFSFIFKADKAAENGDTVPDHIEFAEFIDQFADKMESAVRNAIPKTVLANLKSDEMKKRGYEAFDDELTSYIRQSVTNLLGKKITPKGGKCPAALDGNVLPIFGGEFENYIEAAHSTNGNLRPSEERAADLVLQNVAKAVDSQFAKNFSAVTGEKANRSIS